MQWWGALLVLSVAVIGLDAATGPYILFPIAFVVPVSLAAWHLGRAPAIGFAVVLVACRFAIATTLDSRSMPLWASATNAGIRMLVLIGLALLLAKVAEQQRALATRVETLEGILPICSFCKKIRRPDGEWEGLEVYISERSTAQFSHGLCTTCEREHYGSA
jgi:hypothetical protein